MNVEAIISHIKKGTRILNFCCLIKLDNNSNKIDLKSTHEGFPSVIWLNKTTFSLSTHLSMDIHFMYILMMNFTMKFLALITVYSICYNYNHVKIICMHMSVCGRVWKGEGRERERERGGREREKGGSFKGI